MKNCARSKFEGETYVFIQVNVDNHKIFVFLTRNKGKTTRGENHTEGELLTTKDR